MLASNVDHCQVLADIHTDEDLGKFYVKNGFREDLDALPDSVYALLDYAKIGKQMREDEAGVFTPHGYVVRTEELEPLPDYEPRREISYMIRLTLMNHENEQKPAVLDLPTTEQRLLEVQNELDAPEWYDAQFTGCDAIAPQLNTLLTDVEDLPRINELARSLQELKANGQLTKIKAVIDAVRRSVRRWKMSSTALKSCRNTASKQKSAIKTRWCVMSWNSFSAARMQT